MVVHKMTNNDIRDKYLCRIYGELYTCDDDGKEWLCRNAYGVVWIGGDYVL